MAAIEIKNLNLKFGESNIFKNLNLNLELGHIVGIIGPNGTGKTSLLKMICGMLSPDSGSITYFDGQKLSPDTMEDIAILPDANIFSPFENTAMYIKRYSKYFKNYDPAMTLKILDELKISPETNFKKMSKGMHEQVALALTLSRNAKIVLMDEPLGYIDLLARESVIQKIFANFGENKLFILTTHLLHELEPIIDTAYFIGDGGITLSGDVSDLSEKHQASLETIYREVYKS